jgi:hypothetical protein
MTAPLTLEEAQRDVRAKERTLARARNRLDNVKGCSILVHAIREPDCPRCQAWAKPFAAVERAGLALEVAQRRLEAVESQQRDVQWIGGER